MSLKVLFHSKCKKNVAIGKHNYNYNYCHLFNPTVASSAVTPVTVLAVKIAALACSFF